MAPNDKDGVVAVVQRLADLAGLDTVYRDRYLNRSAWSAAMPSPAAASKGR